jgi:hypothetical protein
MLAIYLQEVKILPGQLDLAMTWWERCVDELEAAIQNRIGSFIRRRSVLLNVLLNLRHDDFFIGWVKSYREKRPNLDGSFSTMHVTAP